MAVAMMVMISDLPPRARRKSPEHYWRTLVHHGAVPASLGGVPIPRPNALGVYCLLAHVLRLRTRENIPLLQPHSRC